MSSAEEAVAAIDDGSPAETEEGLAPILSACGDSSMDSYAGTPVGSASGRSVIASRQEERTTTDQGGTTDDGGSGIQGNKFPTILTRTRGIFGPLHTHNNAFLGAEAGPAEALPQGTPNSATSRRRTAGVSTGTGTMANTPARSNLFKNARTGIIDRVIGTKKSSNSSGSSNSCDSSSNVRPSEYIKNSEKVKALQLEVEVLKIENENLKRRTDEMQAELVRRARVIALQRERCAELNNDVETFSALKQINRDPLTSQQTQKRPLNRNGSVTSDSTSTSDTRRQADGKPGEAPREEKGDELLHPRNELRSIPGGARRRGASLSRLAITERDSEALEGLVEEINKLKLQRDSLRASNEAISKLNKEAETVLTTKQGETAVISAELSSILEQKVCETKELEGLKLEGEKLRNQVAELQSRRALLEHKLDELQHSESLQMQKLRQVEQKWHEQRTRSVAFEGLVDEANRELENYRQSCQELESEKASLNEQVALKKATAETLALQLEDLRNQMRIIENNTKAATVELQNRSGELTNVNQQLAESKERIEVLHSELQAEQATLTEKHAQCATVTADLSTRQRTLEALVRDCKEAEERLNVTRHEIALHSEQITGQLTAAQAELKTIAEAKHRADKQCQQLLAEEKSMQTHIGMLKAREIEIEDAIAEKTARLAASSREETALLERITKAAAEYEKLQREMKDKTNQWAARELKWQEEKQNNERALRESTEALLTQRAAAAEEVANLNGERDSLQRQISATRDKLRDDLQQAKKELDEKQQQVPELQRKVQDAERKLLDLEQEKEMRTSDMQVVENETRQLTLKLEDMREETSKIENRHKRLEEMASWKQESLEAVQIELGAAESKLEETRVASREMEIRLQQVQENVRQEQARKAGLEVLLSGLEARKLRAEEDFRGLSLKVDNLTKMIEELRQEESGLAADRSRTSSRRLSLADGSQGGQAAGDCGREEVDALKSEVARQRLALAAERTAMASLLTAARREHEAHRKSAAEELHKLHARCEEETARLEETAKRRAEQEAAVEETETSLVELRATLQSLETQAKERKEEEARRTERLEADRLEAKQLFESQLAQKQQELRAAQTQLTAVLKEIEVERQKMVAQLDVEKEKRQLEITERLKDEQKRLQEAAENEHGAWRANLEANRNQLEMEFREREGFWITKLSQYQRRYEELKAKTRSRMEQFKVTNPSAGEELLYKLRGPQEKSPSRGTEEETARLGSSSTSVATLRAEVDSLKKKQLELSLAESKLTDRIRSLQAIQNSPLGDEDVKRSVRLESFPPTGTEPVSHSSSGRSQSFETWSADPRDRRWQQEFSLNQTLWRSKLAIAATRRRAAHDSPVASQESPLFSLPEESNSEQENVACAEKPSDSQIGRAATAPRSGDTGRALLDTQTTAADSSAAPNKSSLPTFGAQRGTSSAGDAGDAGSDAESDDFHAVSKESCHAVRHAQPVSSPSFTDY